VQILELAVAHGVSNAKSARGVLGRFGLFLIRCFCFAYFFDLQPGDLLGTGTLSGPSLDQAAALIELTVGGKQPLTLPNGETRTWLEDGDAVVLRGWCERPGAARIGFGPCEGQMLPGRTL